ncbi:MAG: hypothetical protein A3C07_02010 [Candidatus Sungbacteria bacterium RIFCSPHIGHO2_02_FULL_47_11]|uniref:HTH cro/C1-type domain-containing protein n=1 Tax=Candidatus Sungbacteria bacterium RIFCSPHIGHO2_02_FULL_47_11 TaxID=1802270 RepID=A0A1G2KMZ3_9BACT|nr:MAG: hypothetical protein A3C07_02010 [Candidatus Sungbacteria bacterium RIFCSPHIGHO2_02_FULL_47_11]
MKQEPQTLGERLRAKREALGLDVKNIAEDIRVPTKYILAFEGDDYEGFPAKVYAQGFLKKLLGVLTIEGDDRERMLKEFDNEWSVRTYHTRREVGKILENRGNDPFITPRRIGAAVIGIILLAILVFLGWRLMHFVGSPILLVEEPPDELILLKPRVRARGRTERESQLTVNGMELKIDEFGNFDEEIELLADLNTLEFFVRDRFGKGNRKVRYVLVK